MTPIIIDFEWNQPLKGRTPVQGLRDEIIQIGAAKIDLAGSLSIMGYITIIVFGSLLLHTIFAKIFKIDADTMVITSVTYINSPPFVPMIAASMRNKNVLLPGLTIGIVGYALGNYLGLFIFKLLSIL